MRATSIANRVVVVVLLCLLPASHAYSITHRALVFGLGEQLDKSWAKIHGDNDVYYVVQMLQTMGYTDIKTLKNKEATKQGMVQAFLDLAARCNKGDVVYVHYSGHGQLMTDLNGDESQKWSNSHAQWDEAWIPYDAYMVYGEKDRGEKHFCDDEVAKYLQMIRLCIGRRGRMTVVVDACHSGDATCGDGDECVRGVDMKFNIPRDTNNDIEDPLSEEWQTISACQPFQLCSEIKGKQVGKLSFILYSMGKRIFMKKNEDMERLLADEMKKYEGRIKQTPMVRGKK